MKHVKWHLNILKLNVVLCVKCKSAGISIGSEMSDGVSNITIENILVWNSRSAIRIKTAPGRGVYVRQITYRNLTFNNVRVRFVIKTEYNEHPDAGYVPTAHSNSQRHKLHQYLRQGSSCTCKHSR